MAKNLQQQGVPIPDRITTRQRQPMDGPRGGTRDITTRQRNGRTTRTVRERSPGRSPGETSDVTTEYDSMGNAPARQSRNSSRSLPSPTGLGDSAGGGIAGLEGEFIVAIGLLVLLMFANSESSYGDKIMSLIKRGSLTCLLFFILALIAGTGPRAAKIAKAFGALIIVGILLTSPVNTVIKDVDGLIKNDWVGTTESGPASGDSGTGTGGKTSTGKATPATGGTPAQIAEKAIEEAIDPALALQNVAGPGISKINSVLKKLGLP